MAPWMQWAGACPVDLDENAVADSSRCPMKIAARILLPTLLLGTSVALAEENPFPPAAEPPAAKHIDVSFRGSLRDALKRIAEDGGLNLVATGDMDTPVEVRLQ